MNNFMQLTISYLIGSIPFGYIFAKTLIKKDVRAHGSGSTGTTNVMRMGKPVVGLLTLVCDITKGILCAMLARRNCGDGSWLFCASILICILGHIFPVWIGFRGGKGVATLAGTMFVLSPTVSSISVLAWIITLIMTKTSFLGSLALCATFVIGMWWSAIGVDVAHNLPYSFFLPSVFTLIVFSHRSNIKSYIKHLK